MDSVARHFSATWEEGGGSPAACLTVGGRRIAVEVAAIRRRAADPDGAARPRLRFDRVVLRLVGDLQAALSDAVPDGQAVVVTVTAPIRLPGKTADALTSMIRDRLARRPARIEVADTICGNRVRIRLVKGAPAGTSKLIGFVHNPDTDPDVLLDVTQSLLQHIGTAAGRPAPGKFVGDRWLVVADEDGLPNIGTYRHVYAQLAISTDFKKMLLVLPGGRVEVLTG
jgi:hypothetical protein